MSSTSANPDFDQRKVSPSPFRAAFGRARIEALAGTGVGREGEDGRQAFEYALLKRSNKRSADERLWNALGLEGWELVGVTVKHAAFKRRLGDALSR